MINPMKPFNPNDPRLQQAAQAIQGGIPLQQPQRVPIIPWNAFVACGLKVYKDNQIQVAAFAPQPMETADECFQVMRLLISAQGQKPGPLNWETAPESVKKHFQFRENANSPS